MTGKSQAPSWWARGSWCWTVVLRDAAKECVSVGDGSLLALRKHLLEQFGPCCDGSPCRGDRPCGDTATKDELTPPIPEQLIDHLGDWYCPGCDARLPGESVTYEERCDSCGSALLILYEFGVEIEGQWYRPPTKEK